MILRNIGNGRNMANHFNEKETDEDKPKTKFNAGLAKLERIDLLRRGCHDAKIIKDYDRWNGCLKSYRGELNDRMEGERRTEAKGTEQIIDLALNKSIIKLKGGKENHITSTQRFNLMYDYELWLADLEKEFGLSMPDKKGGIEATEG